MLPFAVCEVDAWLGGNALDAVGLDQRSCSTLGLVSTGMGDRSRVYHLGI